MKTFWKFTALFAVVVMFTAAGCKFNENEVKLNSIKVTAPAKTDYLLGEELNKEGLVVEAVYSDETTKDVTEKAVLSGFDSTSEGTKTVTVSYTEEEITKTATFTVNVTAEKLTKIEITALPKTEYFLGEELDTEGLEVTATYSTEKQEKVTDFTVSEVDLATEGTKKVTVTYTEGEITKTAEYEITVSIKKFTVKFDANGGSGEMKDQVFEQGKAAALTANKFKKLGYTFVGWSTKADAANAEIEDKAKYTATSDVTLYAVWAAGKVTRYTVEHYQQNIENDEYTFKEKEILTGETDSKTAAEAKTYTGFTSKAFEQTKIAADESSIVKIYYDRNIITLTFDLKGGNGTAELKGKYGANVGEVKAPTKKGVEFGGWDITVPQTFTENETITARWGYFVTFDANGGNGTMGRQFIDEGTELALTANAFKKPGYEFAGWATKKDAAKADIENKAKYKPNASITLYALWKISDHTPYKVEHYQQNILDDNYTLKDTENLEGTTFTQTAAQSKTYTGFTGKTFDQKEIAADGSTVVQIYYDRNIITFTFDFDGGESISPTEIKGKYGAPIGTISAPSKASEMFKDWEPELPETFTENGTYKATWRAKYTVTFDINSTDTQNLSGEMNKCTYFEGITSNLFENEYKYWGMFFDCWNTEADGSGTSYADKQSVTLTESLTLYAQWKAYKILPETESGTQGTNKRYVLMGMWPQTLKASDVTVDETVTKTAGMYTYYKGSDGEWYAKQTEKRYDSSYTYHDGTPVGNGTEKYFKVEPVKWCELTDSYAYKNGDTASLLLAENELTANVPYYEDWLNNRTINNKTVYPNNYEHSQIRAFLNGLSYQGQSAEQTKWNNKGFLQTAFTSEGLAAILTTEVENGGESTTDAGKNLIKADGSNTSYPTDYTCPNTNDKIFLLSEQEVTTTEYGFASYSSYGKGNTRIRFPTDFAKANYAYQSSTDGYGGYWWLRSPGCGFSDFVRNVYIDGDAYSGDYVYYTNYGFVPALSLKLQ